MMQVRPMQVHMTHVHMMHVCMMHRRMMLVHTMGVRMIHLCMMHVRRMQVHMRHASMMHVCVMHVKNGDGLTDGRTNRQLSSRSGMIKLSNVILTFPKQPHFDKYWTRVGPAFSMVCTFTRRCVCKNQSCRHLQAARRGCMGGG